MKRRMLLTPIALAVAAPSLFAAGFQANEHSASGLGRAFSGEGAVADNASVLARNPAAMTLFDKAQFSGAISVVDPQVDITQTSPVNQTSKDVAPTQLVPGAYYISPINEQWAWGIGLFTNYGVATDYPDGIYAGDLAGDTSLITVSLNPNIAYRFNESFSIGAGVNLTHAEAELTRHKGGLAPAFGSNNPSENLIGLKGDTFGYGWNIGALYEINDNNRLALTYRSSVDLEFKDGEFSSYDSGIANAPTVDGRLDVTLPSIWELSGYHKFAEKWALHYSWFRTEWSSFTELKATSPDCNDGTAGQCFFKKEDYSDNDRYSVGFTHYLSQDWTIRAGFALDKKAGKTTLSIPDTDRYWYSAGFTYQWNPKLSFDAGITYIHGKPGSFTEENAAGEVLTFDAKSSAAIGALQVNYVFD
ncbi:outer membrane protein transport protein [Vibrio sp. SCSIO 43140]|uniref:outer membrane protein transport protein n=1 Tax=Vibrio sp. SCSIO 43140 TaxID=2819100 RepID=UPI0020766770|nr:outer membrane protein transport protein [Vibrio sp. SCSIO 43140]USD63725.1 outer membrane protein transport protein [Vibrio sp. SCSIO 43140]